MNVRKLEDLLRKVKSGKTTLDQAMVELKSLPFEDLGFTRIDHHRSLRKGFPEVIWGQGKSSGQILPIMKQLKRKGQNILITRLEEKKAKAIQKVFPKSRYYSRSHVLTYLTHPIKPEGKGTILVITAGTTDIPVAEEAAVTAQFWEIVRKPCMMWVSQGFTGSFRRGRDWKRRVSSSWSLGWRERCPAL
jgi:NCAIR mutase (PurE)-related protein